MSSVQRRPQPSKSQLLPGEKSPGEDVKPSATKRKRQPSADSPRKRTVTAWTGDELETLVDNITEGKHGKEIVVPGRTAKQAYDLWV